MYNSHQCPFLPRKLNFSAACKNHQQKSSPLRIVTGTVAHMPSVTRHYMQAAQQTCNSYYRHCKCMHAHVYMYNIKMKCATQSNMTYKTPEKRHEENTCKRARDKPVLHASMTSCYHTVVKLSNGIHTTYSVSPHHLVT